MAVFRSILLLCFLAIPSITISLLMPALSKIHLYFSVNLRVAELGIWIILFGYFAGQLIYIPLSKHFNSAISLRFGFLLIFVSSLLLKLAITYTTFWLFEAGELLMGVGLASCFCCTFAIMNASYTHTHMKRLLPFSHFPFSLLGAAATLVASYFTENGIWKDCINVIPGIVIVGLIGSLFLKNMGTTASRTSCAKAPVNYKVLIIYSFIVGSASYMVYGYSIAMPSLVTNVLDISLTTYGTYTLIASVVVVPTFFLTFYSLKLLGARRTIIYSSSLTLLLTFVLFALRFASHKIVIPLFVDVALLNITTGMIATAAVFLASNSSTNTQYAGSLTGFITVASSLVGLLLQDILPFSTFNNFLLVIFVFFSVAVVLSLIERKGTYSID